MKFLSKIYKTVETNNGKTRLIGKTYVRKNDAIRYRNSSRHWFGSTKRTYEVYEFPVGEGKPIA